MSDFSVRLEQDEHNPDIVTKMHCTFESSMDANRVNAFLEDLQRQAKMEYHVETVIEEMRRTASHQLYVRIGFRVWDGDEEDIEDEECMGK